MRPAGKTPAMASFVLTEAQNFPLFCNRSVALFRSSPLLDAVTVDAVALYVVVLLDQLHTKGAKQDV